MMMKMMIMIVCMYVSACMCFVPLSKQLQQKLAGPTAAQFRAFELLFLHMQLQVYHVPQESVQILRVCVCVSLSLCVCVCVYVYVYVCVYVCLYV